MIEAIIFDLDNTLYKEEDYYLAIYNHIANIINPKEKEKTLNTMIKYRQENDATVFNRIIDLYDLSPDNLSYFVELC